MKKQDSIITMTLGNWSKINPKITLENIYVGDIYICLNYSSKSEEFFQNGGTDYEGADVPKFEMEIVKKNAILVKLVNKCSDIYVDIDDFQIDKIREQVVIGKNGNATIYFYNNGIIMKSLPLQEGMLFVKPESVKKFEYKKGMKTGVTERQYTKVKTFCKKNRNF